MQYRYQIRHGSDLVMAGQTSNTTLMITGVMPNTEYMVIINAVSNVKGADAVAMVTTGNAMNCGTIFES